MGTPIVTEFITTPTLQNLQKILRINPQESDDLDFKSEWIEFDKVAKHVLAMANTLGGVIVFGVKQGGANLYTPSGLETIKDKRDLFSRTRPYLPPTIDLSLHDFHFGEECDDPDLNGKTFQILIVRDHPNYIPYVCLAEGLNIRRNAIYVRKGTESIEADYSDLQEIINRRIETTYSTRSDLDLEHHLSELKMLYNYLYQFSTMFSYDNYPGNEDMLVSDLETQAMDFTREVIGLKEELIRKKVIR